MRYTGLLIRQSGRRFSSRCVHALLFVTSLAAIFPVVSATAAEAKMPPLALRGNAFELSLWIGTTMYNNHWRAYESEEAAGTGPWFNREIWTRRFAEMERQGLSVLAVTHPHPYPAFVRLPGFPEAAWGDDATFERNRDMLRWIVSEGRKHGVSLYFLTWNICLPPRLASAHGLPEFGADTDFSRRYTREAIAAFFKTYPGFGGLITMAAESPPGCVDFVADAVVGGLRDAADRGGEPPSLVFWSWCSYPEDSRRIVEAYPGTRILHYLQYEQLFIPRADPRIGRFSAACGNARMVALGGPKSAEGYTFWGDPEWARDIVRDLVRQNGDGLFIETYCEEPWLAQEAFAAFAREPSREYRAKEWERMVGEHYGRPDIAKPLYKAMVNGSRIIPRLLTLLHSQSDHFMPQAGLPLAYYLEMPTLDSYVFENVQTLDANGYLRPNLGLCWPNPEWGASVQSIKEFAERGPEKAATSPECIANEISDHAHACDRALDLVVEHLDQGAPGTLPHVVELLRFNAALGRHNAAKIRAAIAWAEFLRGKKTAELCSRHLRESLQAWQDVVRLTDHLYPKPIGIWQSNLIAPPPWTQNQIWNSYSMECGHWRDRLEPFRREVSLVEEALQGDPSKVHLPLWEELLVPSSQELDLLFEDGFEGADETSWDLPACGALTREPALVQTGGGAILLDSRTQQGEWHGPLALKAGKASLEPGKRYLLTFDYCVVDPGKPFADAPFCVAARSASGGAAADIGAARSWTGPPGSHGRRAVLLEPRQHNDYVPFFSLHGQAALAIDNVRIHRLH